MKLCKYIFYCFFWLLPMLSMAQIIDTSEKKMVLHVKLGDIAGTVKLPDNPEKTKVPVALIIAGSGPTDRNGNSMMSISDNLLMLADSLAAHGIASLRYDKRGVGESHVVAMNEAGLRFENYIDDAKDWVKLLEKDKRFSKVFIIGHSEGSLIGIVASQTAPVAGLVSIAGAGRPAGVVLREELTRKLVGYPGMRDTAFMFLSRLEAGESIDSSIISKPLRALFRPSVQPYFISWLQYNPANEIAKVKVPVLILQGNNDLQISTVDEQNLAQHNKNAKAVTIPGMTHVFKDASNDAAANMATYNDRSLGINKQLVAEIVTFITGKR